MTGERELGGCPPRVSIVCTPAREGGGGGRKGGVRVGVQSLGGRAAYDGAGWFSSGKWGVDGGQRAPFSSLL
jgi:hypothetical protein